MRAHVVSQVFYKTQCSYAGQWVSLQSAGIQNYSKELLFSSSSESWTSNLKPEAAAFETEDALRPSCVF